jgi:hypothetical protein
MKPHRKSKIYRSEFHKIKEIAANYHKRMYKRWGIKIATKRLYKTNNH